MKHTLLKSNKRTEFSSLMPAAICAIRNTLSATGVKSLGERVAEPTTHNQEPRDRAITLQQLCEQPDYELLTDTSHSPSQVQLRPSYEANQDCTQANSGVIKKDIRLKDTAASKRKYAIGGAISVAATGLVICSYGKISDLLGVKKATGKNENNGEAGRRYDEVWERFE